MVNIDTGQEGRKSMFSVRILDIVKDTFAGGEDTSD